MREFFRLFVWGMVAAASLTLAIFAAWTEAGSDRARHAALQLREVVMPSGIKPARPLDAVEGRKLAETVRVLTADRERLLARIAALENNVDDMTGSIRRVERAARPVPTTIEQPFSPVTAMPPQPPAPAKPQPVLAAALPAQAPPAVSAPPPPAAAAPLSRPPAEQVTASINAQHNGQDNAQDQTQDATPAAPETTPAQAATPPNRVTRRQFGLDLGGASSEEALRPVWTTALRRHNALLQSLRPLVLSREQPRGVGIEYRLIAGPIGNAAKAARYCAAITGTGGVCQPTMYEGQKFASH
jgi:hypothetical protein